MGATFVIGAPAPRVPLRVPRWAWQAGAAAAAAVLAASMAGNGLDVLDGNGTGALAWQGVGGFDVSFSADGAAAFDSPRTSFSLRAASYAGVALPAATATRAGGRVELRQGPVTAWYRTADTGTEQGYTLLAPPATGAVAIIGQRLTGGLLPVVDADGLGASLVSTSGQRVARYDGLKAFDAAGRVLEARMASAGGGLELQVDTTHAAYPVTVDPLIYEQVAVLERADGSPGDATGYSVAVDGGTAVVGVPQKGKAGPPGVVDVFIEDGGIWTQTAELTPSISTDIDDGQSAYTDEPEFGTSVAIDGDVIVVGAPKTDLVFDGEGTVVDEDAGAAYVFRRNGAAWTEDSVLTGRQDEQQGAELGTSVAIDGDRIIVGSPLWDGRSIDSGLVTSFVDGAGGWSREASFQPQSPMPAAEFGFSVAIAGERAVVGAPYEGIIVDRQSDAASFRPHAWTFPEASGAAYVFDYSDDWIFQARLDDSAEDEAGPGDAFGSAVDIDGDTIVVGAPYVDRTTTGTSGTGAVFVYDGSDGIALVDDLYDGRTIGSRYGAAVSVQGNVLVVGAPTADDPDPGLGTTRQGAVYRYERASANDDFELTQRILAADAEDDDELGESVDQDGDRIVAGAPNRGGLDAGSEGTASAQVVNRGSVGAAYVFEPNAAACFGNYVPLPPQRILDTRTTGPIVHDLDVQITGNGGVPAEGVDSVVFNLTVPDSDDGGFVTVFPTGSARPLASSINFEAHQIRQTLETAKVGAGGKVSLYNLRGRTQVAIDVQGYYVGADTAVCGATYTTITPHRLLDTRTTGTPLNGGVARDVVIAGNGGVPADATGVAVNLTVDSSKGSAYVALYPKGSAQPPVSNINTTPGRVQANLVKSLLGPGGAVTLFTNTGSTDVVLDVQGYFMPGGPDGQRYVAITPERLADSRVPTGVPGPIGPRAERLVPVNPRNGLPAIDMTGVLLHVTGVQPTEASYLTVHAGPPLPLASNVNLLVREDAANLVLSGLNASGGVDVYNFSGTTGLVVDLVGYYQPQVQGVTGPTGPAG